MPKDALIRTNPYLKNSGQRDAALSITVESSTAIEGVRIASLNIRKPSKKRMRPATVHESGASYGKRR